MKGESMAKKRPGAAVNIKGNCNRCGSKFGGSSTCSSCGVNRDTVVKKA